MRLVDVLSIIKGFMEIEITRRRVEENAEGKYEEKEDVIYKGRLSDWDVKLADVIDEYVDFIYIGYSDHISVRLK